MSCSAFYMITKDLNSGSYACITSTSLLGCLPSHHENFQIWTINWKMHSTFLLWFIASLYLQPCLEHITRLFGCLLFIYHCSVGHCKRFLGRLKGCCTHGLVLQITVTNHEIFSIIKCSCSVNNNHCLGHHYVS